jgi:hypothetical protein
MFWGDMSVESYNKKLDALAERVYRTLTKDGGIFLMDPAPDCILTVNFFAALAEVQEVNQEAMASLFKETYQELDKVATDSSDEGIGGLLTKLIRRRETLKEAEKKAKAIASQAKTRISRNTIYKNCSALVDSLVGGDAIRMVVLGA